MLPSSCLGASSRWWHLQEAGVQIRFQLFPEAQLGFSVPHRWCVAVQVFGLWRTEATGCLGWGDSQKHVKSMPHVPMVPWSYWLTRRDRPTGASPFRSVVGNLEEPFSSRRAVFGFLAPID